jgi:hypothetical protein
VLGSGRMDPQWRPYIDDPSFDEVEQASA